LFEFAYGGIIRDFQGDGFPGSVCQLFGSFLKGEQEPVCVYPGAMFWGIENLSSGAPGR
jgi:hypothetical protein